MNRAFGDTRKGELKIYSGPQLKSGGTTPQFEFYPIVVCTERVTWEKAFAIGQDGNDSNSDLFEWNKARETYRPVVVHRLKIDDETVCVGVVHTTPGGSKTDQIEEAQEEAKDPKKSLGDDRGEFYRVHEYEQTKAALLSLAKRSTKDDGLWVVCGDFYLMPEAIVRDPTAEHRRLQSRATRLRKLIALLDPDSVPEKKKKKKTTAPKEPKPGSKPRKPSKLPIDVEKYTPERRKELAAAYREELARLEAAIEQEANKPAVKSALAAMRRAESELKNNWPDRHKKKITLAQLLLKPSKLELVRNEQAMTLTKVLREEKLEIAYSVSGSNWLSSKIKLLLDHDGGPPATPDNDETRAKYFAIARIADVFFYGQQQFQSNLVGLLHPDGQIVLADSENRLTCTKFWAQISDHFPIGGVFSTSALDDGIWRDLVRRNEEATQAANWLNRYRVAFRYAWLCYRRQQAKLGDEAWAKAQGEARQQVEAELLISPEVPFELLPRLVEAVGIQDEVPILGGTKLVTALDVRREQRRSAKLPELPAWLDPEWVQLHALFQALDQPYVDGGPSGWQVLLAFLRKLEPALVSLGVLDTQKYPPWSNGSDGQRDQFDLDYVTPYEWGWDDEAAIEKLRELRDGGSKGSTTNQ